MDRPVPEHIFGDKKYIRTIVGVGGNLELLTEELGYNFTVSKEESCVVLPSNFYAFLAQKNQNEVQFDLYFLRKRKTSGDTETDTFRRGLGKLLVVMLQTNYTISSTFVEELRPPPERRLRF